MRHAVATGWSLGQYLSIASNSPHLSSSKRIKLAVQHSTRKKKTGKHATPLLTAIRTLLCLKAVHYRTQGCKTKPKQGPSPLAAWLKQLSETGGIGVCTAPHAPLFISPCRYNASSAGAGCLGGFVHMLGSFLSAKIFSSYFFLERPERNTSSHKDFSWGLRSTSKYHWSQCKSFNVVKH